MTSFMCVSICVLGKSSVTSTQLTRHPLSPDLFQTQLWSRAHTRPSVTRLTAALPEPRCIAALAMTVTGPTRVTATVVITTAQGQSLPAQSCWSQPCCCVWPWVSCKFLHLFLPFFVLFSFQWFITSSLSVLFLSSKKGFELQRVSCGLWQISCFNKGFWRLWWKGVWSVLQVQAALKLLPLSKLSSSQTVPLFSVAACWI